MKRMLIEVLLVIMFVPVCWANDLPQTAVIEPNGIFLIEGTLWGYQDDPDLEDMALGFYKGSVYLVSLGTFPIVLKAQNSDYLDLILVVELYNLPAFGCFCKYIVSDMSKDFYFY